MEAKLKIFCALIFFMTSSAEAWTGTRMRKSSIPSIISFVTGTTLTSIRPKQKWQYQAQGGSTPYTFDIQGGAGTTTAAGLYTAPTATTGATVVRVSDSAGGQATTTVTNSIPLITMANANFQVTGEPQGAIVDSGGAGGNYGNNETSLLLIRGDQAHTAITLTFDTFSTESGYDFLKIYDGETTGATLLGSFSGASLPSPVTATSGTMLIRFSSDGAAVSSGFSAHWSITPVSLSLTHQSGYAIDAGTDENLTVTGGVGPFTFSIVSGGGTITPSATDPFVGVFHAPSSAGTTVVRVTDALNNTYDETLNVLPAFTMCTTTSTTVSSGVAYDPGGPSATYANNLNCGLVITPVSAGSGIQLNVDYIALENGYDKLYVYDGTSAAGTLLATYTGYFPAAINVQATSGSLFLKFVSDSGISYNGHRVIWKVLP